MQEKHNTVFIVATANDISNMPPEFLRKGRFDELFFVNLPNDEERRNILEIHLKKRKKFNRNIYTITLIKETRGYNGADLESIVKESIEKAFINNKEILETSDLLNAIKSINSISKTLGDTIKNIKEAMNKLSIRPASKTNEQ